MAYSKNRRTADLIAADGTVSGSKIPANAIDSTHYVDGSIDTAHIAADNIVTSLIGDDVALGGNPTTTTQSGSNSTTRIATTAFVQQELTTLIGGAPSTLNDLNELAAAINDDANYNSTLTTALATKSPIASPTFTGTVTTPGLVVDTTTLVVDSTNNRVGIGIASPATELEVKAASGYAELRLQGASGSSGTVEFYNASSKTGDLYFDTSNNFIVRPAGTEKMRLDASGNVGIGDSTPTQAKLNIGTSIGGKYLYMDDGSNGGLQIKADTSAVIMEFITTGFAAFETADLRANEFIFKNSGTSELVRINGSGVGIGCSPSYDLHIQSTVDSRPHLLLEGVQNHDTDDAPILEFYTNDSTTGGIADSTYVGEIIFSGDEKDGNSKEIYGKVRGMALDPGSGTSNKGSVELWSQVGGTLQRVLNARQIQSSGATGAIGINEVNPAYTFDINTTGESNALRIYQGNNSKDASMVIQNAGTGTGDDSMISLYTAQGAGDPKIRFGISGDDTFEMGIDNSDGNKFKISQDSSGLGTTDRVTLGTNGNMMIGTEADAYAFATKLIVGDADANDGITIQSGTTHQGNVAFNDGGTTAKGRISYQHGTNYMQFYVDNALRLQINKNGLNGQVLANGNGVWGVSGAWGNAYDAVSDPNGTRFFYYLDLQGLDGYTSWGYVWKDRNGRWRQQAVRTAGTNFRVESGNRYFQTQQNSGANQSSSSGAFRLTRLMGHNTQG